MSKWREVSREQPCICGRTRWCTIAPDGTAFKCMRLESARPVKGGGWYHHVSGKPIAPKDSPRDAAPKLSKGELLMLDRQLQTAVNPKRLEKFAERMGLSVASLQRLHIGRANDMPMTCRDGRTIKVNAWSFPMVNANGHVIGIRYRTDDGRKFSHTNGSEGLFVPSYLPLFNQLLICEGPTSCTALLDLGFDAIGRPACNSGVELLLAWMKKERQHLFVILGDHDDAKKLPSGGVFYPGQDGAIALAHFCQAAGIECRVLVPPLKDARDWKLAGVTKSQIQTAINRAPLYMAARRAG